MIHGKSFKKKSLTKKKKKNSSRRVSRKREPIKARPDFPGSPPPLKIPERPRKGRRKKPSKVVTKSKALYEKYQNYVRKVIGYLQNCLEVDKRISGSHISGDTHKNADGSIDGQLTISGLSRSMNASDVLSAMSECLTDRKLSRSVWISSGFRFPMKGEEDDERYDHYRGYNQVLLYPRRGNFLQEVLFDTWAVTEKVNEYDWGRPVQIIFRLNWNPHNFQPHHMKPKNLKHVDRD